MLKYRWSSIDSPAYARAYFCVPPLFTKIYDRTYRSSARQSGGSVRQCGVCVKPSSLFKILMRANQPKRCWKPALFRMHECTYVWRHAVLRMWPDFDNNASKNSSQDSTFVKINSFAAIPQTVRISVQHVAAVKTSLHSEWHLLLCTNSRHVHLSCARACSVALTPRVPCYNYRQLWGDVCRNLADCAYYHTSPPAAHPPPPQTHTCDRERERERPRKRDQERERVSKWARERANEWDRERQSKRDRKRASEREREREREGVRGCKRERERGKIKERKSEREKDIESANVILPFFRHWVLESESFSIPINWKTKQDIEIKCPTEMIFLWSNICCMQDF